MSQTNTSADPRVRLRDLAARLVRAYRALCQHTPDLAPGRRCASCEQIAEVHDMLQCFGASRFEASALCTHFQSELATLMGSASDVSAS